MLVSFFKYFQPTGIFFQHYELSKIQINEQIAAIK